MQICQIFVKCNHFRLESQNLMDICQIFVKYNHFLVRESKFEFFTNGEILSQFNYFLHQSLKFIKSTAALENTLWGGGIERVILKVLITKVLKNSARTDLVARMLPAFVKHVQRTANQSALSGSED